MKIAVTYNEYGGDVLQRRGPEATEHYNEQKLARVVEALRSRGHEVQAIEADLHVIERLENFFSPTADQPWPGMVFNLAYGRQGLCRYSHLPGILEMMGLPYLGSDPLGHALASDKISAKRIFRATGLPTSRWAWCWAAGWATCTTGWSSGASAISCTRFRAWFGPSACAGPAGAARSGPTSRTWRTCSC